MLSEPTTRFRVVLVEDDEPLRRLTKKVLELSGRFQVVAEAGDGSAGVDAARRLQPEIVLLDLAMPKMGGMDALPLLRRVAPTSKVVALSMLRSERFAPEALALGAVAFIDKSVSSQELVRRLLGILEPNGGPGPSGSPPGSLRLASVGNAVQRWLDALSRRPSLSV